jgi:hypothetical protein
LIVVAGFVVLQCTKVPAVVVVGACVGAAWVMA